MDNKCITPSQCQPRQPTVKRAALFVRQDVMADKYELDRCAPLDQPGKRDEAGRPVRCPPLQDEQVRRVAFYTAIDIPPTERVEWIDEVVARHTQGRRAGFAVALAGK